MMMNEPDLAKLFNTEDVRDTFRTWAATMIAMRVAGVQYHRSCSGHYPDVTDEQAELYAMQYGVAEVCLDMALTAHLFARSAAKPDVLQPALTKEQIQKLLRAGQLGEEELTLELGALRVGVVFR